MMPIRNEITDRLLSSIDILNDRLRSGDSNIMGIVEGLEDISTLIRAVLKDGE